MRKKKTPYVMPPEVKKHRDGIIRHLVCRCGCTREQADKMLPKKNIKLSTRRALDATELAAWSAQAARTRDPVVRAALCFLPHSGLRATEVCMLNRHAIRYHRRGSATILLAGKNGKVAQIHVPREGARLLKAAEKVSKDDTWVFGTSPGKHITQAQLRGACQAIARRDKRFKGVTPHFLRHTFVTAQIGRCEDIADVKAKARHNSLRTTMTYAHPEVLDSHWKAKYNGG